MTRHVLRKGFSVQEAPGGVGHLIDSRTGDALVLSPTEFAIVSSAGRAGLDPEGAGVTELLARLGPFLLEVTGEAKHSFFELDIADAPPQTQVPSIAPVVPAAPARASPPRVAPLVPETAFPSGEAELRAALTVPEFAAAPAPVEVAARPTEEHPAFQKAALPEATGERPDGSGQFLSQEANLRLALESHPTEQVPVAVVQGLIGSSALPLVPGAAARPSRRPVLLTVVGVTLLALGVAATFALRPGVEVTPPPTETPAPTRPVVAEPDAGPRASVDAGLPVTPVVLDAGRPAEPDAGAAADRVETDTTPWLVAEVQGRGRVKMGELVAPSEGELTWQVADGQRVKARQVVGSVGTQALSAPAVGLTIFKQQAGATVTRGTVLAEIIYFEAWARGVVKGATPTTAWRCEIASTALQQHAECKISVVAPRGGGAQVTVAIEPRWFDTATDAVLRLAPP